MADEELIDVHGVAELLGCSARTVWRLRSRGAIPQAIVLAPGVIRWRRATILKWLDELDSTSHDQQNLKEVNDE
jgi:predicted DNA-binding transcriptional regulator AlpA